jgi:hypothetical protein
MSHTNPSGFKMHRIPPQFSCAVIPTADLDDCDARFLQANATHHKSDFWWQLEMRRTGGKFSGDIGSIAIVRDQGEIAGWARTDLWYDGNGRQWPTLEAFVRVQWRGRGIAAFAASGLASGACIDAAGVAVFAPPMLLVARRAGLRVSLFVKDVDGFWRLA